ncbi:prepilin peptidase [Psychromicrobium xiongbiense]|uniref:prepilin peptidase n=1 Tax=Psychromicrobium xiongbiense TaxID=3051184 RepID=UPI0025557F2C|nr:prepilin peptidase [Psychromicrobium sp. YIM S02556]
MFARLEELTAVPWAGLSLLVACACLLGAGAWLSVVDIRSHLLPNRIVYPSVLAAVILLGSSAVFLGDAGLLLRTLGGGIALGASYLALRIIYPAGMGLGDVKFAVLLGCYLGYLSWWHLLYATVATFLLGGLVGMALILSRRGSASTVLPFGPFMMAGTMLALAIPA